MMNVTGSAPADTSSSDTSTTASDTSSSGTSALTLTGTKFAIEFYSGINKKLTFSYLDGKAAILDSNDSGLTCDTYIVKTGSNNIEFQLPKFLIKNYMSLTELNSVTLKISTYRWANNSYNLNDSINLENEVSLLKFNF